MKCAQNNNGLNGGAGQFGRDVVGDARQAIQLALLLLLVAPVVYAQPAPPPVQQLVFSAYHASGLYYVGHTVGWIVSPGPVAPTYAYKWTIRRNNKDVLKEGKVDLGPGKNRIEIVGDQPEMIYVAVEPYANLPGGDAVKDGRASVRPTDLRLMATVLQSTIAGVKPVLAT